MHGHRAARLCAPKIGLAEGHHFPAGELENRLISDEIWSLAASNDRATYMNGVLLFATSPSRRGGMIVREQEMDESGMTIN